jgi:hypothetical protein
VIVGFLTDLCLCALCLGMGGQTFLDIGTACHIGKCQKKNAVIRQLRILPFIWAKLRMTAGIEVHNEGSFYNQ